MFSGVLFNEGGVELLSAVEHGDADIGLGDEADELVEIGKDAAGAGGAEDGSQGEDEDPGEAEAEEVLLVGAEGVLSVVSDEAQSVDGEEG